MPSQPPIAERKRQVMRLKKEGDLSGLIKALGDKAVVVAESAQKALISLADEKVVFLLLEIASDPSQPFGVRQGALDVLQGCAGRFTNTLIGALKNQSIDPGLVARLLYGEQDKRAVPALIQAAKARADKVLIGFLGKFGDRRAVDALRQIKARQPTLRLEVDVALARCGERSVTAELIELLRTTTDDDQVYDILEALLLVAKKSDLRAIQRNALTISQENRDAYERLVLRLKQG